MSRQLVYEDANVRRYEARDADGNVIGTDEESKVQVEDVCPTCGRPY